MATLEEAFAKAARLPKLEQALLAEWILAEMESERSWDKLFAASAKTLEPLAEEALVEHKAGRTRPFDPDDL